MIKNNKLTLTLVKLIIVFSLPCSIYAEEPLVEINFKDLEIKDFISFVSTITSKNILIPMDIPGKVNFVSIKPIKKDEIYDLLISVLRSKGFTLMDTNNGYLQIVHSVEASKEIPIFLSENKFNQIQTDIIIINNLDATQVYPQIKLLQSQVGQGIISKASNSLVLTDYPKNLEMIKKLIKKIDTSEDLGVKFVTLNYASSDALLPQLIKIVSTIYNPDIPQQRVEILQNEGSNTLIIIARPAQQKVIETYIQSLDKNDDVMEQIISIVFLKNADAEGIQKTLTTIIAGQEHKKNESRPKITAEKETNSLIIISSKKEANQLKEVIQQLDVDRQQVFVQAKIFELNHDKASEIGAKYGILGGISNSSGLYTMSANMGSSAIPFNTDDIGIAKQTLNKAIALGATISFLNTNGAADILSEPSLLCINNLESSIYVGQTESVISTGTVDSTTTDVTKNTYTRQDIGLTLSIKPRISTDNKVTLDIKAISEDVVPGSQAGLPSTTKREVKTTAIVQNGESIIIGGLVKEKQEDTTTKVPLLGDIPLLGEAFTHNKKTHNKVSLVVILTPYIISKNIDLGKLRDVLGQLSYVEEELATNFKEKKPE
jgi:general secretion pathway protein D